MKKIITTLICTLLISTPVLACEAHAKEAMKHDVVHMEHPYAFATAPNAKTGAVFMSVHNSSDEANSLVDARSDVAEIVEIHQNFIDPDDGMMMMRKIKKIDIGPNGKVLLEPTGYHVMLINLKQPLTKDETFPLTLIFENGEEIEQDVVIVASGSKPETEDHVHEHEHDEDHEHFEQERMDFSDTYLKAE